jgi:hypothetical protein
LKTPNYIPGNCNIGGAEIRRRWYFTIASGIFSVAAFIFLFTEHFSRGARFLIFFPLVVTVIGWQQTQRKFCLAYGLSGVFNFGTPGDVSHIQDPVARAADRSLVLKVVIQSALAAGAITLVAAILPQ